MSDHLHLIAQFAGRTVALPSHAVESVVDLDAVVPVPLAAPGVAGIAALRSRVVTVIDPSVALGEPPRTSAPGRAVVVRADGHHYAVLVDRIDDVVENPNLPVPPGLALDGGWSRAARGVIDHDGLPVLIVDPVALLPATA